MGADTKGFETFKAEKMMFTKSEQPSKSEPPTLYSLEPNYLYDIRLG